MGADFVSKLSAVRDSQWFFEDWKFDVRDAHELRDATIDALTRQ